MFTCTGRDTVGETDLGALKFCASLCGFSTIPAHTEASLADRDAIISDGEVILINRWPPALAIEINERLDSMIAAVFVVGHCIMRGVKQKLGHMRFRQILLHGEPVVHESVGIMSGSRPKEREDRKVAFRIRGCKHVQVVTEVMTIPMGIPTDVTVRLMVNAIAFAVADTFFQAVAGK